MGDYQQQNQRVRRNQLNTEGDINLHRGGYQQQGQRVGRDQHNVEGDYHDQRRFEEHIGRDKAGRDINHNYFSTNTSGYATGAKHAARAWVTTTVLVLLFFSGLVSGGVWWFSTHPLNFHLPGFGTDPSAVLNQDLYGTPAKALEQFCNQLAAGNAQGAYDDFSSHLKNTYSLSQFTTDWTGSNTPEHCTSTISTSNASSASGTIVITYTVMGNGGFSTKSATYNVTLVSDNGIWQIDSWQKANG